MIKLTNILNEDKLNEDRMKKELIKYSENITKLMKAERWNEAQKDLIKLNKILDVVT